MHSMVVNQPVKRKRTASAKDVAGKADVPQEALTMWSALHQFSIVGGLPPPEGYEPKQRRLEQILERLPGSGGSAVIVAEKSDITEVEGIVKRHCQTERVCGFMSLEHIDSTLKHTDSLSDVSTRASSSELSSESSCSPSNDDSSEAESISASGLPVVYILPSDGHAIKNLHQSDCQYVINYSFPSSGRKYVERFSKILKSQQQPHVVFTMVDEEELQSRRCREVVGLLRRARQAAMKHQAIAGTSKAVELQTCLQQLNPVDDEDAEEEDDGDVHGDDRCTCALCLSQSVAGITFHAPDANGRPRVEAVRIHMAALENLQNVAPLIQPRLQDNVCTIICHHCLFDHTVWDEYERFFALPAGMGSVRVIFVLAEEGSFHAYPDTGSFYGGTPWINILDMDSMDKTDRLLEQLVDKEIELLKGRSDRIVLFGISQGAGQSMLRFIRSRQKLGGWIGAVGHVPTVPHTPRDRDPLTDNWRPSVNCDRPIRLLNGGKDTTFPPSFILRDIDRLRIVGGFSNVLVDTEPELSHEGWVEVTRGGQKKKRKAPTSEAPPSEDLPGKEASTIQEMPDLLFLRKHLPSVLGLAPR